MSKLFPDGPPQKQDEDAPQREFVKWDPKPSSLAKDEKGVNHGKVVEGLAAGELRSRPQRKYSATKAYKDQEILKNKDGSDKLEYMLDLDEDKTVTLSGALLGAFKIAVLQADRDDVAKGDHVRIEQLAWEEAGEFIKRGWDVKFTPGPDF